MTKQEVSHREAPAYPIGSVDKALRLLLLVAERPGGIRIGEASALLGVAPSTAHRLLQMLSHYGFAEQDPRTPRPMRRARRFAGCGNSRARVLELSAARTRIADGEHAGDSPPGYPGGQGMAVTLLSVESPHLLRVGDRSGHSQPAHLSAMGKVLLAGSGGGDLGCAVRREIGAGAGPESQLSWRTPGARSGTPGYALQEGEVESGVSASRSRRSAERLSMRSASPTPPAGIPAEPSPDLEQAKPLPLGSPPRFKHSERVWRRPAPAKVTAAAVPDGDRWSWPGSG